MHALHRYEYTGISLKIWIDDKDFPYTQCVIKAIVSKNSFYLEYACLCIEVMNSLLVCNWSISFKYQISRGEPPKTSPGITLIVQRMKRNCLRLLNDYIPFPSSTVPSYVLTQFSLSRWLYSARNYKQTITKCEKKKKIATLSLKQELRLAWDEFHTFDSFLLSQYWCVLRMQFSMQINCDNECNCANGSIRI